MIAIRSNGAVGRAAYLWAQVPRMSRVYSCFPFALLLIKEKRMGLVSQISVGLRSKTKFYGGANLLLKNTATQQKYKRELDV
jgi:hypothetical protein